MLLTVVVPDQINLLIISLSKVIHGRCLDGCVCVMDCWCNDIDIGVRKRLAPSDFVH
jgi:hypothetical protein